MRAESTVRFERSSASAVVQRFIVAVPHHPWLIAGVSLACVVTVALFAWRADGKPPEAIDPAHKSAAAAPSSEQVTEELPGDAVSVEVVKPALHGLGRKTTQPGSVHAFQYAELYAKTSGYLGEQNVDIGDRVKRGQVLAVISVPELESDVKEAAASLERAKSVVAQMHAHVLTSQAEAAAATATVKQMEAEVVRSTAQRVYREKEFHRMEELFALKSIDKRLVDEKQDATEAARAAEMAAHAAVEKSKAEADAAAARIAQAKADVQHAETDVQVAEAVLAKQKVLLDYTRIESPYDGVVTLRKFHPGSFIRAADQGGEAPLLSVARTDVVRVVVQVPDRDVPFTNVGDEATVEIDALPGKLFSGKVSRVADSENPQTRTMRVEIDLPNDKDWLREGMYGRATIQLAPPSKAFTIPASALVGKTTDAKGKVYIVRDGKAALVPIDIGQDDGLQMEVLDGLKPTDDVIVHYRGTIGDGRPVRVATSQPAAQKSH
ncbi:MAG TPA: efflux RND transporter periplasmic adaptor subunit [Pirellulales bacterium]|jgi:RND family efflux transporter MFP subunit